MRNILVAVLGTSPAVITEAFYYYAKRHQPPVVFSEVHVFTTSTGRDLMAQTLLGKGSGKGKFHELLEDLRIPREEVTFDRNTTYVFQGPTGQDLADVRSLEDSKTVADQICTRLGQLVVRTDTAVYATIAGGRKTMGLYLAMAMQLLARNQDCLFHVLLDPRLGEPPPRDFFYPKRKVVLEGQVLQPQDVRLDCDEIPLLRWPSRLKSPGPVSFLDLLEQQQSYMNALKSPPQLTVDSKKRSVRILGRALQLERKEFYYYCLCAQLASGGLHAGSALRQLPARDFGQWWTDVRNIWKTAPQVQKFRYIPGEFIRNARLASAQSWCFPMYQFMSELYWRVYVGSVQEPSDTLLAEFQKRITNDFTLDQKDNPTTLLQTFSRIARKIERVIPDPALVDLYRIRKGQQQRDEPEEKSTYGIWLSSDRIVLKEDPQ